ncbi:dihydrodipicolinate synthase family protein [Campylobacter jejuni]
MGILKGTLPALLTPYKDDGSINEKEFIRYCEFGISKGLNGLFCNGSAGDSQALSVEEQVKLMKLTKKATKNNIPIITGITSTIYENTFILAQKAYELGLDALLLAMPYYYKLSEDALFEYVKYLASEVKLPLYVYNIPLFAPALSLKFIEKVSKLDNVVGIKDSSGDALLLKARGFEFVNASIHPLSPATKEELNTRFDEAKELIKTIEKETGIKL